MKCQNCGTDFSGGMFCPGCGTKHSKSEQAIHDGSIQMMKREEENTYEKNNQRSLNETKDNNIYDKKIPVILSIPVILLFGLFTCGLAIPIMGIIRLAKYPKVKLVGSILLTTFGGVWILLIILVSLFPSSGSPNTDKLYENIQDAVAEEPVVEETKEVVETIAQPTPTPEPEPTPAYDLSTKDGYLASMGITDIPDKFLDYFYYLAKTINDASGLSSIEAIRKELYNVISEIMNTPEEELYQYASMFDLLDEFESTLEENIGEKTAVDLYAEVYDTYGFMSTYMWLANTSNYVDPSTLYSTLLENGIIQKTPGWTKDELYSMIALYMSGGYTAYALHPGNAADFVSNTENIGQLVQIQGSVGNTFRGITDINDIRIGGEEGGAYYFQVDTSLRDDILVYSATVSMNAVLAGYTDNNSPVFIALP